MKRKSFKTKIVTFCLACFILVTPLTINAVDYSVNEDGAVMAGEPVDNRIYTIYTQSGKVFDVWNGLKDDNTDVWTYTYNGDMCQEWRFIRVGTDYAIQDTNSQKYLTVKDASSSVDAEIVIKSNCDDGDGWVEATDYYPNQLFSVQQIGTSMRYRILTKSSNYSLAIGYNSSRYLRQLATTDTSTQVYFEESAPYHGLQEGYVHIQEYNSLYALDDMFLGIGYDFGNLCASAYSNSANYQWLVRYRGGGCYSFANNGYYLTSYGSNVEDDVRSASFHESDSIWRVIKSDDYYELVPDSAYAELPSGEIVIDACLGLDSNAPVLVNTSDTTRRWRIIRCHHYYNYDLSMYVMEDDSHSNTHAYIFNYVCSALSYMGNDNQNIHYEIDEEVDLDADDITNMIDCSDIFVIYAHGMEDGSSITLNAKDINENNKGERVSYNLSNINSLADNSLYSLGCAIFFSCHSAEGAYTDDDSYNFVNAVIDRGAKGAIGFDGKVNCDSAKVFAEKFFTHYVTLPGSISARALEPYREATRATRYHDSETYKPYFTNGVISLKDYNSQ